MSFKNLKDRNIDGAGDFELVTKDEVKNLIRECFPFDEFIEILKKSD